MRQPGLRTYAVHIERRAGAASTQDQVNGAVAGVKSAAGGFGSQDWSRLAGVDSGPGGRVASYVMVTPSHGPTSLVIMVMPAEDHVHSVAVEERQPGLTNPLVTAVAALGGAHCVLMHLYDDPVDALILFRGGQGLLEPACLRARTVATNVQRGAGLDRRVTGTGCGRQRLGTGKERAAVLIDHVIGRE